MFGNKWKQAGDHQDTELNRPNGDFLTVHRYQLLCLSVHLCLHWNHSLWGHRRAWGCHFSPCCILFSSQWTCGHFPGATSASWEVIRQLSLQKMSQPKVLESMGKERAALDGKFSSLHWTLPPASGTGSCTLSQPGCDLGSFKD